MKFNHLILALVALVAVIGSTIPAAAQDDLFAAPREVVLAAPQTLNTIGQNLYTNGPIDISLFGGIARVDVFSLTNASGQTWTATFQGSLDQTNWAAIPDYAVTTGTSFTYTNFLYGGTNLSVTQTVQLPGTVVTPTAASAGFSTPYLARAQYTNSGALTVTVKGYYSIGFPANDANKYLRVLWTQAGTGTNFSCGAVFVGTPKTSL